MRTRRELGSTHVVTALAMAIVIAGRESRRATDVMGGVRSPAAQTPSSARTPASSATTAASAAARRSGPVPVVDDASR